MKRTLFKGSGVALITPYDRDNKVNLQKLRELIELHIKSGTEAIVLCGTTGESPVLSLEEKISIFNEGVTTAKGRIPIIAGTGCNDTAKTITLSSEAQKAGVDGLLIVTPYYNKTTQNGLISHYFNVADTVNLPIILYNVPSRTGLDISLKTYSILSKHENIYAVKEASGNIAKILDIKNNCPELDIYSGNDEILVPSLAAGCIGIISVAANIIPKAINAICKAYLESNINIITEEQLYWQELIKSLFSQVNPLPVKEAMEILGYNTGLCRPPLYELEKEEKEKLTKILKNYSLI